MITDEERRKIAEELRESNDFIARLPKASIEQNAFDIFEKLLECIHYEDGFLFEYIADLIDRPTCRLELTDTETYGNVKVRIYECSECGRTCEEIYGKYERCPHCGAVVLDED